MGILQYADSCRSLYTSKTLTRWQRVHTNNNTRKAAVARSPAHTHTVEVCCNTRKWLCDIHHVCDIILCACSLQYYATGYSAQNMTECCSLRLMIFVREREREKRHMRRRFKMAHAVLLLLLLLLPADKCSRVSSMSTTLHCLSVQ
jgi:hypothetical protein